jgi:hypothetical protein
MAEKQRSPNYPGFGLPEAILKAKQLYERDGKSAVPRDVAVQAWGYQGINGASLRALGALRQYGLLETPTPGTVKVSGDGLVLILEPEGSNEWKAALSSVAMRPVIFRTLAKQYPDGLPSDAAVVSFLVREVNFSQDASRAVISSYRDTLTLAKSIKNNEFSPDNGAHSEDPDGGPTHPQDKPNRERSMPMTEVQGAQPYDLTLALMGGVQATLRIPRHMSEANYMLLTSLIEANLKAMKPALITPPTDPPQAGQE